MNIYEELLDHTGRVMFASWFGFSRQNSIGLEQHSIKNIRNNDIVALDILPRDLTMYDRFGIRGDDLILIWVDDDKFIPVTVKWYDELFNTCVGKVDTPIDKNMYDSITEFIKERMMMSGINE